MKVKTQFFFFSIKIRIVCKFLEDVSKVEEQFANDIVYWILLTDQWPLRMSYILQVIEDADQRAVSGRREETIDDNVYLLDVYKW